jgi:hypothetical protein
MLTCKSYAKRGFNSAYISTGSLTSTPYRHSLSPAQDDRNSPESRRSTPTLIRPATPSCPRTLTGSLPQPVHPHSPLGASGAPHRSPLSLGLQCRIPRHLEIELRARLITLPNRTGIHVLPFPPTSRSRAQARQEHRSRGSRVDRIPSRFLRVGGGRAQL